MVTEVTLLLMANQSIHPRISNAVPPIEKYLRVIGPVVLLAVRAKHAQNSSRTDHCRYQAVLSRQMCAVDLGI